MKWFFKSTQYAFLGFKAYVYIVLVTLIKLFFIFSKVSK